MPIATFTAGQILTAAATNSFLVNNSFAVAAGSGFAGAVSTTVTYPASRFTVAPILIHTNAESTLRNVTANSAVSFTYQNTIVANATYFYVAVQMTSTTAAG